jgi:hypothetical protein
MQWFDDWALALALGKEFEMDVIRIGAGIVLGLAFVGALLVRNEPPPSQDVVLNMAICGQDHGAHGAAEMAAHMQAMAAGAEPGHAALIDTMEPMHTGMMRGLAASDFDAAFLCSMLPHHQGAVDMARVAVQYGQDPFVTMLAHQIIADQEREIGEMARWLERREAVGQ